ncbi:FDLD family class I lanthipeptide [Clostridium beijerinckii]|nr:FDLD family class I lanthipeptide [Clostridium beijerinckii]
MAKLGDFDLDLKVKIKPKGGVTPATVSRFNCTLFGCIKVKDNI